MTLMPVSNISVLDSSWSNAGGVRWISHRSLMSSSDSATSSGSPRVLNTWPLVTSPTGTVIGLPVSVTSAPRTRPSVGCIEMARTRLSPRCWATSRVSVLSSPPRVDLDLEGVVDLGHGVDAELDVDDRPDDAGDPTGRAWLVGGGLGVLGYSSHRLTHSRQLRLASASAPPTISLISWVISAWRAALALRV